MRKELYRKGSAPAAGSTFIPKGPRINTNVLSIQEEGEGPELKKPTKWKSLKRRRWKQRKRTLQRGQMRRHSRIKLEKKRRPAILPFIGAFLIGFEDVE